MAVAPNAEVLYEYVQRPDGEIQKHLLEDEVSTRVSGECLYKRSLKNAQHFGKKISANPDWYFQESWEAIPFKWISGLKSFSAANAPLLMCNFYLQHRSC